MNSQIFPQKIIFRLLIFPDPRWGIANCIRRIMQSRKQCAWCLSTGHVHAVVAATVGVVGKELIGCKFNVSGCCGAVRHRITPAIDDVLRPAASGEKADTPHQSTAMNRKREGRLYVPKLHGLHCPLARDDIYKSAEVAGEIAKRPGDQSDYRLPTVHLA